MGFFNWSAPLIHRYGQRWTARDIAEIASALAPALVPADAVILDVGGGSGGLAVRLADEMQRNVIVLDPTPELLARVPEHRLVRTQLSSAEQMPFGDGSIDAVVITDAFHHFTHQEAAIEEVVRVLRPTGRVVIHEPDPRGWMRLIAFGEKLLGEPGALMRPEEMCRFMREHGLDGECSPRTGYEYRFMGMRTR